MSSKNLKFTQTCKTVYSGYYTCDHLHSLFQWSHEDQDTYFVTSLSAILPRLPAEGSTVYNITRVATALTISILDYGVNNPSFIAWLVA